MRNIVFGCPQNDLIAVELWLSYYCKYFDNVLLMPFNLKKKAENKLKQLQNKYKFRYEILSRYGDDSLRDGEPWSFAKIVNEKQAKLIEEYDWVMYTNIDEFMVTTRKYKDLRELMDKSKKEMIPSCGYDIIQVKGEGPLDYSKPILEQRRYWIKNRNYNKTLLARVCMDWAEGAHRLKSSSDDHTRAITSNELYLIHLKHADMQPADERDLGPYLTNPDPNIVQHWLKRKRPIPQWIKKSF